MSLGGEQLALAVEAARIAAERAIAADHAVARDQHRDMIVAIRGPDRTHGFGLADCGGDLGVAARLAEWDFPQLAPDLLLEGRAGNVDRQLRGSRGVFDRGQSALN